MLRELEGRIREKCKEVTQEKDTDRLLVLIEHLTNLLDEREATMRDTAARQGEAGSKPDLP
jgi:hypothetical protein